MENLSNNNIDSMFNEKVSFEEEILYKILDKESDDETTGFDLRAKAVSIHNNGLILKTRQQLKNGEVMMVKVTIDGVYIHACCSIVSCHSLNEKEYIVEVEFMIVRQTDLEKIESYLYEHAN